MNPSRDVATTPPHTYPGAYGKQLALAHRLRVQLMKKDQNGSGRSIANYHHTMTKDDLRRPTNAVEHYN